MDREKLLQNPLPIDRVAYRVTKRAKEEDQWRPMPGFDGRHVRPGSVLRVAAPPEGIDPESVACIGKRRGRLTVLGYAAEQPAGCARAPSMWVVRCDCGNHEHRRKVQRWLRVQADDRCAECAKRSFLLRGKT